MKEQVIVSPEAYDAARALAEKYPEPARRRMVTPGRRVGMTAAQSIHEAELQRLKELASKLEPEVVQAVDPGELKLAAEGNRRERRAYAAWERRERRKAVRAFERQTGPWRRFCDSAKASGNNPPDPTPSPSESNPT